MSSETSDIRRALPAVDRLLGEPEFQKLIALYGRDLVRLRLRQQLDEVRGTLEEEPGVGAEGLEQLLSGLSSRVGTELTRSTPIWGEPRCRARSPRVCRRCWMPTAISNSTWRAAGVGSETSTPRRC
jgi:hypothetical protein